jgi:Polyketide cyclase / dehydrase and lipid transport
MTSDCRHLSALINRPPDEVYEYAADPANLPEWAPGLGSSVEQIDGQWFVETSMGQVGFAFAPRNTYGVLDHEVTLPSGEVIYNPMRGDQERQRQRSGLFAAPQPGHDRWGIRPGCRSGRG